MPELFDSELSNLIVTNKLSEAMLLVDSKLAPLNTLSETHVVEYFQWMNKLVFGELMPTDTTLEPVMQFTSQLSNKYPSSLNVVDVLLRRIIFLSRTPALKTHNKKVMLFFLKANLNNKDILKNLFEQAPAEIFNDLLQTLLNENSIPVLSPEILTWMNQLRETCLVSYDLKLFNLLEQIIGEENLTPLSDKLIEKLNFLKRCPPDIADNLHQIMHPIITAQKSKKINHSIPYLLAAIKEDKTEKYQFTPTLLVINADTDDFSQFEQYFQSIASLNPPIKEHFILANQSAHWVSGEVRVDETGIVRIFISDASFNAEIQMELINKMSLMDLFPGKTVELYITNEQRQQEHGVCMFYAINDLRQLYTLDQYGPKEDLFYQLNSRITQNTNLEDGTIVKVCKPPLALMRSMQSRKVFTAISPEHERIINKDNQTLRNSTLKFFSQTESGELLQNKRIKVKQQKMIERLDAFIMRHLESDPRVGYDYITRCAKEHEFPAFQEKISIAESIRHNL